MFQALARDRLERLNASPSATPWSYFRVYSALLLVLSANLLWYFLDLNLFAVHYIIAEVIFVWRLYLVLRM